MRNGQSRLTHDELLDLAAAAIVRQYTAWGVTEAEARAAIERNFDRRQRLGPELAAEWTWDDEPYPTVPEPRRPAVIDLRDREAVVT